MLSDLAIDSHDLLDVWLDIIQQRALQRMQFLHVLEPPKKTIGLPEGFISTWRAAMARLQRAVRMSALPFADDDIKISAADDENDIDDASLPLAGFIDADVLSGAALSARDLIEDQTSRTSKQRNTLVNGTSNIKTSNIGTSNIGVYSHLCPEIDPILSSLVQLSSLCDHQDFPALYLETVGLPVVLNCLIRRSFGQIDDLLTKLNSAKERALKIQADNFNSVGSGSGTGVNATSRQMSRQMSAAGANKLMEIKLELVKVDSQLLLQWRRLATTFRLLANFVALLPPDPMMSEDRREDRTHRHHENRRLWMDESLHIARCCQYLIAGILVERGMVPYVVIRSDNDDLTNDNSITNISRFVNCSVPPSTLYYDAQR